MIRVLIASAAAPVLKLSVLGAGFYPLMCVSVLGLMAKFKLRSFLFFFVFISYITIVELSQHRFPLDGVKIIIFLLLVQAVKVIGVEFVYRYLIFALRFVAIIGIIQYLCFLLGFQQLGMELSLPWAWSGISSTPVDLRGGVMRVSSFANEPGYFNLLMVLFIFLKGGRFNLGVAVLGFLVSLSVVGIAAVILVAVTSILAKRSIYFPIFCSLMSIILVSIVFAWLPTGLQDIVHPRIIGILTYAKVFSPLEYIFGVAHWPDEGLLTRPFSSFGSALFRYGLLGLLFYILALLLFMCSSRPNRTLSVAIIGVLLPHYFILSMPIISLVVGVAMFRRSNND